MNELTNTTNTPPYSDPMVKVVIAGLGLLWFDETNNVAEFGFVKVPGFPHPLYIVVCEDGNIVYLDKLEEGSRIEMTGQQGNRGMGKRYEENGKPAKDFRWMVDLDDIHNPPLPFKSNPGFFARMRINIDDAIYYTESLSSSNGTVSDVTGISPIQVRPPQLIGFDIGMVTEKDATELRIDGGQNLLTKPNSKYSITIRYKCESSQSSKESDFKYIYDVLDTNVICDLEYENEEYAVLTACEVSKINSVGERLAKLNLDKNNISPDDQLKMDLKYVNALVSCEVMCQDAVFAKYSRTVPW